jgi:hypothetical protein
MVFSALLAHHTSRMSWEEQILPGAGVLTNRVNRSTAESLKLCHSTDDLEHQAARGESRCRMTFSAFELRLGESPQFAQ